MKDIKVKAFLSCNYTGFPSCCLMGIISGFAGSTKKDIDQKNLDEFIATLEHRMAMCNHTSVMFTDIEGGPGYVNLSEHPKVMILNAEFNKNSGNTVYIMQYFI